MPIFSRLQQRRPKATDTITKPPNVTVIQSAATLLAPEKRQQHIKNIKSLLNLPPKLHQRLYQQVIDQFAEFVQALPETARGTFGNEGGFLDHGLERASRALSLCLAYFFPQEKSFQSISSLQALWIYAVFTAALLYDIGKLAVKYHIEICQKDGTATQTWSPYTSSMVAQGRYYKFDFVKENRDNLRRLVTGLLARQILDEAELTGEPDPGSLGGFNWIASNPDVLEAWLALLSGDTRFISSYLTVIPLADIQTLENQIKTTQPNEFATDLSVSEEFLQWLRQGLANETISVNEADSQVHITQDGVVILNGAFNQFLVDKPDIKQGTNDIARQFRSFLDLYQISVGEQAIAQSHHAGSFVSFEKDKFLIINNTSLLFAMGQTPKTYSNVVQIQNAAKNLQPPPATRQSVMAKPTPK